MTREFQLPMRDRRLSTRQAMDGSDGSMRDAQVVLRQTRHVEDATPVAQRRLGPPPPPHKRRACRRCYGYDPNPARDERCGACHTGVDCSRHLLDTFSSLKRTTNRSSRASRPRSRPRSASRAPRRPRAGLPSFGDTSDAISRQPLRVGRVDRCWCQWHGWGASWQRDKPRRAPRHTGTLVPFTVKRTTSR